MLIPIFNSLKSAWSRVNDWIKRGEARVPVPPLTSPQAVADYIGARFIYTGDPLNGAADFYLHPERLHAAMLEGPAAVRRLSVDYSRPLDVRWLCRRHHEAHHHPHPAPF